AGLRPVDKLTEAVEHVARTEDLGIRIPVDPSAGGGRPAGRLRRQVTEPRTRSLQAATGKGTVPPRP
ncbi:hypothetical protein ACWDAQ_42725, partial [Streptomyces sp. NPDC001139]